MFFKQLRRYWEAFNIDVKIEKINKEHEANKSRIEEESKNWKPSSKDDNSVERKKRGEFLRLSKEKLKELHDLAEEVKIAPETVAYEEDTPGNLLQAQRLENRLRYHAVERQALFIGGVALLVGFGSFIISIVALLVAIVSR